MRLLLAFLWCLLIALPAQTAEVAGQTSRERVSTGTNSLAKHSTVPTTLNDFHARTGAGFSMNLDFSLSDGHIEFLPSPTPPPTRSLVCGIQEGSIITLLPLCTSRFEAIPSDVLKAPEGVPGIRAEYFNGTNFNGGLKTVRVEPNVDYGIENPVNLGKSATTNFSARWSGLIIPNRLGSCNFAVIANGGIRLWIGGRLRVNEWHPSPLRLLTVPFTFTELQFCPIRLDYLHTDGVPEVHMAWNWGTYTATPSLIAKLDSTLQTSTYQMPADFSVTFCSPFATGDSLSADTFSSQCQLAPAFGITLTVTNKSPEPRNIVMLMGLNLPAKEINGTHWSGISYRATDGDTNSAPLVLSTESGQLTVRDLNWSGASTVHGVFTIPCEVPPHSTLSRVFWLSRYDESIGNSDKPLTPLYRKIWGHHEKLIDWLFENQRQLFDTTEVFDRNFSTFSSDVHRDEILNWRGYNSILELTTDSAGKTNKILFPSPYSGNATNALESHLIPAWFRSFVPQQK